MEEQSYLLKQSARFASITLARIPHSYTFHTLEHTKYVVRAAAIIGRATKLSLKQRDTVLIAAWFHDVGYVEGAAGHEERSSSIAMKMLTTWGADSKRVTDVSRCILATKFPQSPRDILGMVLCDADLAHLGSPQYEMHVLRLRQEQQVTLGDKFENEQGWHKRNIEFLKAHHYLTEYGNDILDRRKKENINKMIRQLNCRTIIPMAL